ncbi:hypothetical protein RND61_11755 [Streptomyces sp. TRM76323]|uniref:UL36 very large tegument protein n=1 Tax=Streptomyces tamarix TaxID=3078565 RepID=A0ABU3QIZ0_9ACTN|nr:hypothetical protein [Streptomyces tamarix]MDT9682739.1 hypothetical protein [Streptomyces tamarix]
MTEHHPTGAIGAFARWLRGLTALLDPDGGWYGTFRRRDPHGTRACLDGTDVPPWDVVESLLHDVAALHGVAAARERAGRARHLHAEAAAAHDRRPGGGAALEAGLRLAVRERAYAARRGREVTDLLAAVPGGTPEAGRLANELAWLRDDHARAASRVAELRARLASLPRSPEHPGTLPGPEPGPGSDPGGGFGPGPGSGVGLGPGPGDGLGSGPGPGVGLGPGVGAGPGPARGLDPGPGPGPGPGSGPVPGAGRVPEDAPGAAAGPVTGPAPAAAPGRAAPAGKGARGRARGARYAWPDAPDGDGDAARPDAQAGPPGLAVPVPVASPRGARFGGGGGGREGAPAPGAAAPDGDEAERALVRDAVARLVGLRARGRSGEAHALLCEAALWPASRLPPLAAELDRAGLAADWATLLWEAASLPSGRLAALAGALTAAGRDRDARQLLRQGVARPPAETAGAVLALYGEGRAADARVLVEAFVGARPPEEAARFAAEDPHRLVPEVLAAVRAAAPAREPAFVHALRVAGLVTR